MRFTFVVLLATLATLALAKQSFPESPIEDVCVGFVDALHGRCDCLRDTKACVAARKWACYEAIPEVYSVVKEIVVGLSSVPARVLKNFNRLIEDIVNMVHDLDEEKWDAFGKRLGDVFWLVLLDSVPELKVH